MFILLIHNHMMSAVGSANPMAKIRAGNRLKTNAESEMASVQAQLTSAPDGSPIEKLLLSMKAKAAAIIPMAIQFIEEGIRQQKDDLASTKATHKLAEPARG